MSRDCEYIKCNYPGVMFCHYVTPGIFYEIFGLTSHCESCHGSSIKYILGIVDFAVLLVITHHLFQNARNIRLIWSNS